MSSIGASYAGVYVMQKRQKEKMEKKEDETRGKGESSIAKESKVSAPGRTKKVHAENFQASDTTLSKVFTNAYAWLIFQVIYSCLTCVLYKFPSFRLCFHFHL
ncbi:hypothetical protein PRUPE_6G178000, partial [Prunus persica]